MSDFVTYVQTATPSWLLGPYGQWWMQAHATIRDAEIDGAREAVKCRFPGYAAPDALAAIASERTLEQMPAETVTTWRTRLLGAFDAWQWGGTKKGVLDNLTLTGLATFQVKEPIDWPDGDTAHWARFWVLASPNTWTDEGTWGDGLHPWGDGGTWGSSATEAEVQLVLRTIRNWKGAHAFCVAVIVPLGGELWGDPLGGLWGDVGTWGGAAIYWHP